MNKVLLLICILIGQEILSQHKGASPAGLNKAYQESNKTLALVVGISDYQDPEIPDLLYADKDALAFANFLRSPAGGSLDANHLRVLINKEATAAQFAMALDWLLEVSNEGDQVIIYFSGHGDVEKKTITQPGFLLCYDAPSRIYMVGGAFALPMLQEIISTLSIQTKAKVIVIADACRSGKLSGSSINGPQLTSSNLAQQMSNEIKILSCQANEYSIEGEQWGGGRGVFSYHLLNGLYGMADNNKDHQVTLMEIGRYLEEKVSTEVSPISQVPITVGNRSEKISRVDPAILSSIKTGASDQSMVFTSVEIKGIEDLVVGSQDTNTQKLYSEFKNALKNKQFFEPQGNCANDLYERLSKIKSLSPIHNHMRRNYAAALQDDVQQVMNKWLKSDLKEIKLSTPLALQKYKNYSRQMERAAEMLGEQHYLYKKLKSSQYFFEGYQIYYVNDSFEEKSQRILHLLHKSLEWDPDMPHTNLWMCDVFLKNRRFDSAKYYFIKTVNTVPFWPRPYVWMANGLLLHNRLDEAYYYLDKATQVDTNYPYLWISWGNYYLSKFEYDLATKAFNNAILLDSTLSLAYSQLAYLQYYQNQLLQAEKTVSKGIQLAPDLPASHYMLGGILTRLGKYKEAEQSMLKAIQLDSTIQLYFEGLMYLYIYSNQIDKIPAVLNKSISINPKSIQSNFYHGYYLYKKNKLKEAENKFIEVMLVDTTVARNAQFLIFFYIYEGRYEAALEVARKCVQLDSLDPYYYAATGWALTGLQQFEQAAQAFEKHKSIEKYYPENIQINQALLYSMQNNTDRAFEILEELFAQGYINDIFYLDIFNYRGFYALRKDKERWNRLVKKYQKIH